MCVYICIYINKNVFVCHKLSSCFISFFNYTSITLRNISGKSSILHVKYLKPIFLVDAWTCSKSFKSCGIHVSNCIQSFIICVNLVPWMQYIFVSVQNISYVLLHSKNDQTRQHTDHTQTTTHICNTHRNTNTSEHTTCKGTKQHMLTKRETANDSKTNMKHAMASTSDSIFFGSEA